MAEEVISDAEDYYGGPTTFDQYYRCYPVSFIDKDHLEKGDKVIMPASALERLAQIEIDYPMLFKLSNPSANKETHCGVLEFVADEGLIYLPRWMMRNMKLEEGDLLNVKNASLSKGTYVKLQPHTKDFLDLTNPKAILETTLRSYTCLTTGDTIMVAYNNKKFYINVVEAKPANAVSIVETDCEVEFSLPLDYKVPEKSAKPTASNKLPEVEEVQDTEVPKVAAFTGSARRLDGKAPSQCAASESPQSVKQQQPKGGSDQCNGSTPSSSNSRKRSGKLVFGSNAEQTPSVKQKVTPNVNPKGSGQEASQKAEEPKFKAFTGKKYSLKD